MQSNIGLVDRYVRLICGLLMYGAGNRLKRNTLAKNSLVGLGAMKIAEGVTGFCPVAQLSNMISQGNQQNTGNQAQSDQTGRQQNKNASTGNEGQASSVSGQHPENGRPTSDPVQNSSHVKKENTQPSGKHSSQHGGGPVPHSQHNQHSSGDKQPAAEEAVQDTF